jgi:hypothetical protein
MMPRSPLLDRLRIVALAGRRTAQGSGNRNRVRNSYGIIIVLLHDSFPPLIDEPFGSHGYLP